MAHNLIIIVSAFNSNLTEKMLTSALQKAKDLKAKVIRIIKVPGSFEIPLAIKKVIKNKNVDAVVALGAVLKGGTDHDKVVAYTVARKIMDLMIEYQKPIGMGIIGPDATREQAEARVEEYAERAVQTVITMISVLK